MTDAEPGQERFEAVLVAVLYVLPLLLTVAFLAWAGLTGLALALLAVEAGVSAAVVTAKAPEGHGRRPPRSAVALVVLSVAAGAGAVAVLSGV